MNEGILLTSIAAMFAAGIAALGWFVKIHMPDEEKRREAAELKHMNERQNIREECRQERATLFANFTSALATMQANAVEMRLAVKEEAVSLRQTVESMIKNKN